VTDEQITRFTSAVSLAAELHSKQYRKSTETPYLSHLLAVAALVMEDGGTNDEVIAALLHDSIEDQGDDYLGGRVALQERIRDNFGQTVLDIVNAVTDDDGHHKGDGTGNAESAAWRTRKQQYLDHLDAVEDHRVLRVSCADKLHNVRTLLADYRELGENLWQRFRTKSRKDQVWIYGELCKVFKAKSIGKMALELEEALKQLEATASKS
jgi:(p)ppGpp synthase/HD superfamily hydrolase